MVNEFCGFKHGVIGTDKIPADTTLNNMKKADLIKLLHTAQHNYETLMWFYNNAVKANMSQLNNNSWIPCSERLPEENEEVILTFKNSAGLHVGEATYKNKIFFYVTDTEFGYYEEVYKNPIAWKPKDAPYQPKGE